MSDNQIPTDDQQEAQPSEALVEGANPSQAPGAPPSLPDEYEIGGEKYSREEIEKTMQLGNWPAMQKAHTQRSQEVAEERRELERQRAELEQMRAQSQAPVSTPAEEADIAERILEEQRQIRERLDRQEKRYESTMAEARQEREMEAAIQSFRGQPFYNEDEMAAYMKQYNLEPGQAGVAYAALAGYRSGVSVGEQNAASRRAIPVMGSTGAPGVSPEVTSPRDALPPTPVGQRSWEDLEKAAMEDDGI